MARIVIELTNSCNLRCKHCFDERHAATSVLPLDVVDRILADARSCGIDQVCFTGGEPTVHPDFAEIVGRVSAAGFNFSFVSNGINFKTIHPLLIEYRRGFRGVTFSCDGARESTHDALRGKGAYRRLMRAVTICFFHELPFTFNMVVTAPNQGEVEEMVRVAERLGSGGVRFGHLMPTPQTAANGLDLTPRESREVQARILRIRETAALPVLLAPGFHSEAPFYPCGPLEQEEYNVDCRGNLTLCCQMSGQAGPNGRDVMGNLQEVTLVQACATFKTRVEGYLEDKRRRIERGDFGTLDSFPCWYCAKYMGKVDGLLRLVGHPWLTEEERTAGGKA